jgi:hypothetical protein
MFLTQRNLPRHGECRHISFDLSCKDNGNDIERAQRYPRGRAAISDLISY